MYDDSFHIFSRPWISTNCGFVCVGSFIGSPILAMQLPSITLQSTYSLSWDCVWDCVLVRAVDSLSDERCERIFCLKLSKDLEMMHQDWMTIFYHTFWNVLTLTSRVSRDSITHLSLLPFWSSACVHTRRSDGQSNRGWERRTSVLLIVEAKVSNQGCLLNIALNL